MYNGDDYTTISKVFVRDKDAYGGRFPPSVSRMNDIDGSVLSFRPPYCSCCDETGRLLDGTVMECPADNIPELSESSYYEQIVVRFKD